MALTFGAATSDRVVVTRNATIDNLSAFSLAFWIYPTTLTNFRRLWTKGGATKNLEMASSAGNFRWEFLIDRATVDALIITSNGTLTANLWQYWAFTYDGTDGLRAFKGTRESPLTETTYGTRTVGSGADVDDSAIDVYVGNRNALGTAFQGRIATYQHFKGRKSLPDFRDHQFYPFDVGDDCVTFHRYNAPGTVFDLSRYANHGTVTGATPYPDDFEPWQMVPRRRYFDVGAAAAGDAVPQVWASYRRRRAA